jgi:predicted O-methyltransferase YrrM
MINLLNPDIPALMQKWGDTFKRVEHLNKFDTPTEIMWLCEAASRSNYILECGAHRGVSTKAMALANPNADFVVLDAWHDEGCREAFEELMKEEIVEGRVAMIQGLTDEGFVRLLAEKPDFFPDFVFIDASHLYPDVLNDIYSALSIMDGGLISGHDYRHHLPDDGVTKSVREAFSEDFSLPLDSIWAKEVA